MSLPPPSPPPASDSSDEVRVYQNVVLGIIAAIIIALVAGAVFVLAGGDDEAEADVLTEPTSTASDPFAPPVGTDQSVQPVRTDEPYKVVGGHVGLYGGTLNVSSCDKNQLVAFLQQNPDKGAAWAAVRGITPAQIPTYVAGLTPILLRSDTLVTNHGFKNGRATTIPAVLQAGTAVLVDEYGLPVTKCYCGNPLTSPRYYTPSFTPRYTGPRWPGFSGTSITIIQNNTTIIDTFTLVDPNTGESFTRPRGTDGSEDRLTNEPPTTTTAPTEPPTAPPGPSPEELATQKVQRASQECYPYPAPIEDSTGADFSFGPGSSSDSFVIQVVTHTTDGGTQTFTWEVDRSTIAFTPTNDLAQVASNHCSILR